METFLNKNWKILLFCMALVAIGFFAGRWTNAPEVKTEYVKGETVRDTIFATKLVPYKVEIPAKPTLPMKPDTIRIPGKPEIIRMKVDTAQIIADYIKENSYSNVLFDDQEKGKLTVASVVQYNALKKLGYEFTPIQKQTTIERRRIFTPFVNASYNTLGYYGAGAGLYYYDVGVNVKYLTDFKTKGYEFGVNIKF
jgi:hypothetical protein